MEQQRPHTSSKQVSVQELPEQPSELQSESESEREEKQPLSSFARAKLRNKNATAKKLLLFWILGGPCSGKSLQCAKLTELYNFAHLNLDELIQMEIVAGTELGRRFMNLENKRKSVKNSDIVHMMKNAMKTQADTANGFLIDGYPRTLAEAKSFEEDVGSPCLIIYLNCNEMTMATRLAARMPQTARWEVSKSIEENIKAPLLAYRRTSTQLLSEYAAAVYIDGEHRLDDIFENICKQIDLKLQDAGQPIPRIRRKSMRFANMMRSRKD